MNEQDTAFFSSEEAKRIQELWETKFGDWVRLAPHDLYDFEDGIIVLPADDAEDIVAVRTDDHQHLLLYPNELIFVPRQGQLQEMLEERGYAWDLAFIPKDEEEEAYYEAELWKKGLRVLCRKDFEGPTPSIALGKCLLEALKEE